VQKVRCNIRRAYMVSPAPPSSKRRPHFETSTCLGENKKILVVDLEETEVRDNCAGEDQQQFKRPSTVVVRELLRFSCRELLLLEAGS
jgi:hypothetical protein